MGALARASTAERAASHHVRSGSEQSLRRDPHVSDRVREFVVLLLPRGDCRVEVIAQHLGVDRRTLARHLAVEGTTFSELVDGLRRDLLARYLQGGGEGLTPVYAATGF